MSDVSDYEDGEELVASDLVGDGIVRRYRAQRRLSVDGYLSGDRPTVLLTLENESDEYLTPAEARHLARLLDAAADSAEPTVDVGYVPPPVGPWAPDPTPALAALIPKEIVNEAISRMNQGADRGHAWHDYDGYRAAVAQLLSALFYGGWIIRPPRVPASAVAALKGAASPGVELSASDAPAPGGEPDA